LTAINQLDLRVEPGTIFSIIGPNGAGKTTVFNAVTGIYEPTEGRIRLAGREPGQPPTWKGVVGWPLIRVLTRGAAPRVDLQPRQALACRDQTQRRRPAPRVFLRGGLARRPRLRPRRYCHREAAQQPLVRRDRGRQGVARVGGN